VPLTVSGAADVVRSWRSADPPVTAVCAFNDDVAMAVLAGLAHLGLRAPQDMAVIGVDDIYGAAVAQPPLTTVERDVDHTARCMASRVVETLAGKEIPAEPIRDVLRVVVRESA
jgi:DNA-binding LacI/PurR family transcriptional regulator